MNKTTFPKFTAETLEAALPKEVIAKFNIVITPEKMHIGYATLKLTDERSIDNSDHTVRLENISSITEADSIILIYFDRWCISSLTLSKISDRIHFNL